VARVPADSRSSPRAPAFFLRADADEVAPRLAPEDERHAVRVLRLASGALLHGLDGRGARVPLRVRTVRRDGLELEPAGPKELVPAPGEEGAPLPWFELAVAWPRRNRVDEMVGRLVQLGAACLRPLAARQRGPEELAGFPDRRLERLAREACKQCGRLWLPEFAPPLAPAALAAEHARAPIAVLDPYTPLALDTLLRSLTPSPLGVGTRARPIVLVVGPEGGLAEDELEPLLSQGASRAWLGPHVLRVETAAEAAMAVAAVVHGRAPLREG
jgi:16S rRNA (uracil1498-N3)-methyltransferase